MTLPAPLLTPPPPPDEPEEAAAASSSTSDGMGAIIYYDGRSFEGKQPTQLTAAAVVSVSGREAKLEAEPPCLPMTTMVNNGVERCD